MAFPLDANQTTQTFDIFGLPQNGNGFVAFAMLTLWGPSGEPYSFSTLVTQLNTLLSALTTYQCTRVTTLLTRWDSITSTSPLEIWKSTSGAEGRIVDYPAERENIRQELAGIIGFAVPRGGFMAQAKSAIGGGGMITR
jgi:hypothetical protein